MPQAAQTALQLVQSNSLPALVQVEIEQLILRGELAIGQRINEIELAVRFGTSRGPIREALRSRAWFAPRRTAEFSSGRFRWRKPTRFTMCARSSTN